MEIRVNNKALMYESAMVEESISYRTSLFKFTTGFPFPIYQKIELVDGDIALNLVNVRREKVEKGICQYTAVSEKYFKLLNTVLPGFEGKASTEKVVSSLGIGNLVSRCKTDEVYWRIPSLGIESCIKVLCDYTKVNQGGGSCLFFDLNGDLNLIDLKFFMKNIKESKFLGTSSTFVESNQWITDTPGKVRLFNNNDAFEDILFEKDYGFKVMYTCLTDECKESLKQALRNQFYYNYYTSVQSSFINVLSLPLLTQPVLYEGSKYMVFSYGRTFDSPSVCKVVLCSCIQ